MLFRSEYKPKYDKEAKKKFPPNPINKRSSADKAKRRERAFFGTEYISEDEEEEDASIGVAGLALGQPGLLFTYDYTKDYALPPRKCLTSASWQRDPRLIRNPFPTLPSSILIHIFLLVR